MMTSPQITVRHLLVGLVAFALVSSSGSVQAATATWVRFQTDVTGYAGFGTASAIDTRRGQAVLFGMWNFPVCVGVSCSGYSDAQVTAFARYAAAPSLVAPVVLPGSPSPRSDACAAYDSLRDEVWLFGGRQVDAVRCRTAGCPERLPLDDLWRLDLSVDPPQWHAVDVTGARPAGRHDATLVVDPLAHRLLLFGGHDSTGTAFGDLWSLPLDGPWNWTELTPAGPAPSARWSATALVDAARARMLLVGGATPLGSVSEVWSLDLSGTLTWSPLTVKGIAPTGVSRALIDTGRDLVLAYGGPGEIATFGLSGSPAWTSLPSTGEPSVYTLGGFGYDPVHDVVWLPYEQACCFGLGGGQAQHWLLTLADPPAVPALQPVLDSVRWSREVLTQWWRARPQRPGARAITVEFSVTAGSWGALATRPAPDTTEGGVIGERTDSGFSPGQAYESRLSWTDGVFAQNGGAVALAAPPGPLAMDFTIDAATFDSTGTVNIIWQAADDSLSFVAQPVAERLDLGGWAALANIWPDSNHRIVFGETLAPSLTSVDYRIRWAGPLGSTTGGAVHLTRAAAPPPPPPPPPAGDSLFLSLPRPNPVTMTALLDYRMFAQGPGTITLLDLNGRVVREWSVSGPGGTGFSADLRGVSPGLYLLQLRQGPHRSAKRIAVVR